MPQRWHIGNCPEFPEIVPDAEYELDRVDWVSPFTPPVSAWSAPITVRTAKFGDNWPLFSAPGNPPQPDFIDIQRMVAKFVASPSRCNGGVNDGLCCGTAVGCVLNCPGGSCDITAPLKATCQLQPNVVFPKESLDFRDIATEVTAFIGTPYSDLFFGPCDCPSKITCGVKFCANNVDCQVCDGGSTRCNNDLDCIGPTKCRPLLCVDSFCRDECGRCLP